MANVLITFGIGAVIGCILTVFILRARSVGSLIIDLSDQDDGPYLFLELSKGIDVIYRKRYITLKVSTQNFIPPK